MCVIVGFDCVRVFFLWSPLAHAEMAEYPNDRVGWSCMTDSACVLSPSSSEPVCGLASELLPPCISLAGS